MFRPEGAITEEDDLKVVIILGLPVEVWDVDMNKIYEAKPKSITQTPRGKLVELGTNETVYLKWLGIEDLTYNRTEVLWSLHDDQIGKAEAEKASMYIFNTREEAVAAQLAHKAEQQRRFKEYQKARS